MKKNISSVLACMCILGAITNVNAATEVSKNAKPLTLAVFGDSPYDPTGTTQFDATPDFIRSINNDSDVSVVLHVGDIHSGSQACTEVYDQAIYNFWTGFQKPLVYIPGDNEWMDCHKKKQSGGSYNAATDSVVFVKDSSGNPVNFALGNPIKNLELIRSIFFAVPGHTLGADMEVLSQAQASKNDDKTEANEGHDEVNSDAKYVENVIWEKADTLFVSVNIPGGSNNGADNWYGTPTMTNDQANEITERTKAALNWIDQAFKQAEHEHSKAVVIQVQADMWDLDGNPPSHIANYKPYIDSIAAHTKAFNKPVLLLNGDSHVYRSDNPLVQNAPCSTETATCSNDAYSSQPHGYNVPNFHRITVHGSSSPMEWLKLSINNNNAITENSFGPFSWVRVKP
jgi:Calcineurin-like phosphoesterase